MGKINTGRVVVGGLVAGLIIAIICSIAAAAAGSQGLLPPRYRQGVSALEPLLWLATGIVLAWIYAAIRPRFGPGAGTAVKAALPVWVVGWVVPFFGASMLGIVPTNTMLAAWLVGLTALLAAGWVAGCLYKE